MNTLLMCLGVESALVFSMSCVNHSCSCRTDSMHRQDSRVCSSVDMAFVWTHMQIWLGLTVTLNCHGMCAMRLRVTVNMVNTTVTHIHYKSVIRDPDQITSLPLWLGFQLCTHVQITHHDTFTTCCLSMKDTCLG